MNGSRIGPLLGVALLLTAATARAAAQDFIAEAKRVPVATLDSTMPSVPLERWLAELRDIAPAAIEWEVNDCGEGGDGLEAPTCVTAIVPLTGDSVAHLSVIVLTRAGQPAAAEIWDLSVGVGYSFTGFRNLRDWAERVRPRRR
jgi:hypothetical protein